MGPVESEIDRQFIAMPLITDDSVDPMHYRNQNGINQKPKVDYCSEFFESQGSSRVEISRQMNAASPVIDDSVIFILIHLIPLIPLIPVFGLTR